MKKVKILTPLAHSQSVSDIKPKVALNLNQTVHKGKNHAEAKEVIKRKLISRLGDMAKLDLSKVNETDCEQSVDISPSKYGETKPKRGSKRFTNFRVNIGEYHAGTKEDLNQIVTTERSGFAMSSKLQSNHKKNSSILNGARGQSSSSAMNRYFSVGEFNHRSILEPNKLNNEDEYSPLGSNGSRMRSVSPVGNSDSVSKYDTLSRIDSSADELELLKRKVEEKQTSLPVSLKKIPNFPSSGLQSRESRSISRAENPESNNVDKYFTDIQGNSLLSTMNSTKDIFSSISRRSSAQRRSQISGSRTNRGVNAAHQMIFGMNMQSSKNLPVLSRGDSLTASNSNSPNGESPLNHFAKHSGFHGLCFNLSSEIVLH